MTETSQKLIQFGTWEEPFIQSKQGDMDYNLICDKIKDYLPPKCVWAVTPTYGGGSRPPKLFADLQQARDFVTELQFKNLFDLVHMYKSHHWHMNSQFIAFFQDYLEFMNRINSTDIDIDEEDQLLDLEWWETRTSLGHKKMMCIKFNQMIIPSLEKLAIGPYRLHLGKYTELNNQPVGWSVR